MHSKRTIRPLLLIGLAIQILFVPVSAATNEPGWTKLMQLAYDTHDPRYYLAAVRLAEKYGSADPRLHIAMFNAAVHYRCTKPELAERLLKRDIADLKSLDPDFPDLVYEYYELARVYEWQGRYEEAEPVLLRALAIRDKWQDVSSDDPSTAEILACLYFAYLGMGNTSKAADTEANMRSALHSIRNELTRGHCLSSVEFLFNSQGRSGKKLIREQRRELLRKAREFSDLAVFYFRKRNEVYDLAGQLNVSAGLAAAFDELKIAEKYATESMTISFADFDNMQDIPLCSTVTLCDILLKEKRYKDGEQLIDRYLSILERSSGQKSIKFDHALLDLANFWDREKRPDLAAKLRQREKLLADILQKKSTEIQQ